MLTISNNKSSIGKGLFITSVALAITLVALASIGHSDLGQKLNLHLGSDAALAYGSAGIALFIIGMFAFSKIVANKRGWGNAIIIATAIAVTLITLCASQRLLDYSTNSEAFWTAGAAFAVLIIGTVSHKIIFKKKEIHFQGNAAASGHHRFSLEESDNVPKARSEILEQLKARQDLNSAKIDKAHFAEEIHDDLPIAPPQDPRKLLEWMDELDDSGKLPDSFFDEGDIHVKIDSKEPTKGYKERFKDYIENFHKKYPQNQEKANNLLSHLIIYLENKGPTCRDKDDWHLTLKSVLVDNLLRHALHCKTKFPEFENYVRMLILGSDLALKELEVGNIIKNRFMGKLKQDRSELVRQITLEFILQNKERTDKFLALDIAEVVQEMLYRIYSEGNILGLEKAKRSCVFFRQTAIDWKNDLIAEFERRYKSFVIERVQQYVTEPGFYSPFKNWFEEKFKCHISNAFNNDGTLSTEVCYDFLEEMGILSSQL